MPIDLVTPLKELQARAQANASALEPDNQWLNGYLFALRHAIELAEVQQLRLDLQLTSTTTS